jgi:nucleoside-diphosphate-sugar epimerase
MIEKARKNETIEVLEGEGFASVHVDEVVEALMLATKEEKAVGQVFNVVNRATFVTYYEIAEHIIAKLNSKSHVKIVRPSRLVNSVPVSSDKIQRTLGWKPWITRAEAINPHA